MTTKGMSESSVTPQMVFYGVLLALRSHGSKFLAYGPEFQGAFRSMLEAAQKEVFTSTIGHCLIENFDPVFGVYYGASEMILYGLSCGLISLLGPHLLMASFNITLKSAEQELGELPQAETFRHLAKAFFEALSKGTGEGFSTGVP